MDHGAGHPVIGTEKKYGLSCFLERIGIKYYVSLVLARRLAMKKEILLPAAAWLGGIGGYALRRWELAEA